jgi:hypothetical protein
MFENRFVQSWPFRVNILGLASINVGLEAVAIVVGFVKPPRPYRAMEFKVASWGLMNPGISISLRTAQPTKSPRRQPRRRGGDSLCLNRFHST